MPKFFTQTFLGLISLYLLACSPTPPKQETNTPPPPEKDEKFELAFLSDREKGQLAIFLTDEEAGFFDKIYGDADAKIYGISWFNEGKSLLFAAQKEDNYDIYSFDVKTKKLDQLTFSAAHDYAAHMSPTAKEFTFASERHLKTGEIYIYSMEDKKLDRITQNEEYETAPRFSPNGQMLAFCRHIYEPDSSGHENNGEIILFDRASRLERRLTNKSGYDCLPDWSPDSQSITFHSCNVEGCQIYVVPTGEGEPINITDDEYDNRWPRWSPDGQWISYTSYRDEQTDIYLIKPDGTGKRKLTSYEGRDEIAEWRMR